jgi:hemerythrin-like domain-containing protein
MTSAVAQRLAPLPQSLLRRPLDYILGEHERQRVLCAICDALAVAPILDKDAARQVADYIASDLMLHVIDEEHDLFPLLRRRALPEDEIEAILGQLAAEHAADEDLAGTIKEDLNGLLAEEDNGGRSASDMDLVVALKTFAKRQRRHLALENATVMPLARVRLTVDDLNALAHRMAARRGVALTDTGPKAGDTP